MLNIFPPRPNQIFQFIAQYVKPYNFFWLITHLDLQFRNFAINLELKLSYFWIWGDEARLLDERSSEKQKEPILIQILVTRAGVEPTTFSLGRSCSIQLSYQAIPNYYNAKMS